MLINGIQYIRVSRYLPQNLLYDLMSISDKHSNAIQRKIEMQSVLEQSVWGGQGFKDSNEHKTSQVRIPAKLTARLIGERGRNIANICRDSKTKISIPRVPIGSAGGDDKVIVSITGTQMNIKTAQYLMQKLLKPN